MSRFTPTTTLPAEGGAPKKINKEIQKLAVEKTNIFIVDQYDPRLKTHKLHGRFDGLYAFSINHSYRIIFDFQSKDVARFYQIGNHDIYE